MEIYIIEINNMDKVQDDTLRLYQKKDFSDEKRCKVHCLAYLLVDKFLEEVYGVDSREIIFENGKPVLIDGGKHFSISHSEDLIAIAFSDSNCGVDIEKIKLREFKKISERMNFNAETLGEFYQEWTRYEAFYKLGKDIQYGSVANYDLDDYALTAVSEDPFEEFEIYYQT